MFEPVVLAAVGVAYLVLRAWLGRLFPIIALAVGGYLAYTFFVS